MYAWLFRKLPGPKWLKAILALLIFAGIVLALFTWVYPEFHARFFDNTVG